VTTLSSPYPVAVMPAIAAIGMLPALLE